MAPKLDLRCVLLSDPGTFGAEGKTRLGSVIKRRTLYPQLYLQAGRVAALAKHFLAYVVPDST